MIPEQEQEQTSNPMEFADDASVLAGLDALSDEAEAEDQTQDEGESLAESEPVEGEEQAEDLEAAEVESEPEPVAEPEDAQLAKRLDAIQKAEERSRTQAEEYRRQADEAIAAQKAEMEPLIKQARDFEKMRGQVKYDPGAVLTALGLEPGDMEHAARLLYAMRPEAINDPKTRDAAQRAIQQRQQQGSVSALEAQIAEMKAEREAEKKAASEASERQAIQQQIDTELESVAAIVGEDAPLVAALLGSDKAEAKRGFARHISELWDEFGEKPEHSDVIKRFEKERREKLKSFGIDPDTALSAAKAKNQTQSASEMRVAKTLTNNLGTPTRPRTEPRTDAEVDAEVLAGLDDLL